MTTLIKARRALLRSLGVPAGLGVFLPPRADPADRGAGGSLSIALLEMVAVATVLPLMQLLTGASTTTGVLGRIGDVVGTHDAQSLAIVLALVVFLGFAIKAVLAIAVRWWVLGTLARQEIETSTRMLRYFLTAPYSLHLKRHTGELMRNMNDAVSQLYTQVVGGSLTPSPSC